MMSKRTRIRILKLMVCSDCHINVGNYGKDSVDEYAYMVHDYLWPKECKFLCVCCLENRLGRQLTYKDFDFDIPLNWLDMSRSDRLIDRLENKH